MQYKITRAIKYPKSIQEETIKLLNSFKERGADNIKELTKKL